MKVVRGLADARKALCENRGINLASVPAHVQARTEQVFGQPLTPIQAVERIIREVRERGDEAVREFTRKLDGAALDGMEVPLSAITEAYEKVDDEVTEALSVAAQRIRDFHTASRPKSWMDFSEGYGQIVSPVGRVGAYVPGGT
ncbi:MAG: histidinol dehydrogenase, partial [Chloroflexi bacterium]|nr:histidinol dehydrogenase [Chloroflexota bacterium]